MMTCVCVCVLYIVTFSDFNESSFDTLIIQFHAFLASIQFHIMFHLKDNNISFDASN